MEQERYRRNMEFMAKAVAYNRYLVDSIRRFLGERVLDVGCGVGNTTALLDRPYVVGMDVSRSYLEEFRRRLPGVEAIQDDIATCKLLDRLEELRFDTIFCSNVLEHIEDDVAALANMHRIVATDGVLILLVPHYPALFGAMDEADLHFRRYERRSLRAKLRSVGFRPEHEFCINFPGVFWWYLAGRVLRRSTGGDAESGLVNRVTPIVRVVDRLVAHSAGLSLALVARK